MTDSSATVHSETLQVRSRVRDYAVEFDDAGDWARRLATLEGAFFVIDENVLRLHGPDVLAPLLDRSPAVIVPSEEGKTFATVSDLCAQIVERSAKRSTRLVSIGGGITQDVTGFLASTLYRGIDWVYAPTTLLAMGDSCLGGKTSLNLGARKNLLGTIYPPSRIIIHVPFVATLSQPDFASGVGEIVKIHMVGGAASEREIRDALPRILARDLVAVRHAIRSSLEIKRAFIEEDEFDRGRRNLLNYGHCFGHALESATDFAVPHGLAVVIGMRLADHVARGRGLLSATEADHRSRTLYRPIIPSMPKLDASTMDQIVQAMAYDKKRTGSGLAVVVFGDGLTPSQLTDVTTEEAYAALGRPSDPGPL